MTYEVMRHAYHVDGNPSRHGCLHSLSLADWQSTVGPKDFCLYVKAPTPLRRSPGGGNGNPLQYSCLENPTDSGAWWATVCGVPESEID